MAEQYKICPYPGLRPFNEEESIFFKGRDQQIAQIISQLEERRFLMLTGASGDGKSSLVYAGVIPNARAGFFRARFNNWAVADFRPERDPLGNMAEAIARALNLTDILAVRQELSYGFSALTDLYLASDHYVDTQSAAFNALPEPEKRLTKRKATNLLILVDQFEEFFTNTENFTDGKPSADAQAVINVVLETARIALQKNIPIYVVCTMRSDYIGQCASFTGLPEFIGFSQFFVPRLTRKEIYQVIEEPALLNGDRITRRLVETLISKLDDGIDQLPVLQHALNQIWQYAGQGAEEMDLVHFARAGGLNKKFLPLAIRQQFEQWLSNLPDFKQKYYVKPSLDNVLDNHANELYETAAQVANSKYGLNIRPETAKLIIEKTFKCLTRIDEARAVRNRMTLQEVVHVIDAPGIDCDVAGKVLNIFRMQGNTFLKPFITEEETTQQLRPDSILDITHESLIRNWQLLLHWAREEHSNYGIYQDFKTQLQRWLDSGRNSGYLLPIGPLTYFEDWAARIKPNKHWLVKYDEGKRSAGEKLLVAEKLIANGDEFIQRSVRKLWLNRFVNRHGANKIVAWMGVLTVVISCIYFTLDFRKKQNEHVLARVEKEGIALLSSPNIKSDRKADFILTEERLQPGSYINNLALIKSDSERLDISRELMTLLLNCQMMTPASDTADNPLLAPLFLYQLNLFDKVTSASGASLLKNSNALIAILYEKLMIDQYQNHFLNNRISEVNTRYGTFRDKHFANLCTTLADSVALKLAVPEHIAKLVQHIPLLASYRQEKTMAAIELLNPFNAKSKRTFDLLFPREKLINNSYNGNISLTHNGGYYWLGNLFASIGKMPELSRCLDSIVACNSNFFNPANGFSYETFLINLAKSNVIYSPEGKLFAERLYARANAGHTAYRWAVLKNIFCSAAFNPVVGATITGAAREGSVNYDNCPERFSLTNREMGSLANYCIENVMEEKDIDAQTQNFMLAMMYKEKAFFSGGDREASNVNLEIAFSYYDKLPTAWLNELYSVAAAGNPEPQKRGDLFLTPLPLSMKDLSAPGMYALGNPSLFLKYICAQNRFLALYDGRYGLLKDFMGQWHAQLTGDAGRYRFDLLTEMTVFVDAGNLKNNEKYADEVRAELACLYSMAGDNKSAASLAARVNPHNLCNSERLEQLQSLIIKFALVDARLNRIGGSGYFLAPLQHITAAIPAGYTKRNMLLDIADSLQKDGQNEAALVLTDTLVNNYVARKRKFGNKLFYVLAAYGATQSTQLAYDLLKDVDDGVKSSGFNCLIKGTCATGNYYQAWKQIPAYVNSSSQLNYYITIMKAEVKHRWPNDVHFRYIFQNNGSLTNHIYEWADGTDLFILY